MKPIVKITMPLLLLFFGSALRGETIDTLKSKVIFEAVAVKMKSTEGSFTGMKGNVNFDPGDLLESSFDVCIDASSINSGNKMRDKHLRSDEFFYVDKYPEICFISESIEKSGDQFVTRGRLTIRDLTREIEIPFSFDGRVLQGSLVINRFDYQLGTDVGTFKASEEATVTIICELTE